MRNEDEHEPNRAGFARLGLNAGHEVTDTEEWAQADSLRGSCEPFVCITRAAAADIHRVISFVRWEKVLE